MTTAVQVQYRRGTSTQVASFTGAAGEMVVDTTNNRVVVQDGATAGGWPAAKFSEAITNARTAVADANYAVLATDRSIAYTAITAARTVTLPAASSYPTGTRLMVFDESGSSSATNTITLSANGSDTIDGSSSAAIKSAYGYLALQSNGAGKWTIVDQAGAVGGVSSLNTLTGSLSIAATDGAAVSSSGTTVSIGGPGGMVNKFRNGTMDVWQRGTSALTATTSGSYTADGWIVLPTGASVTAAQAGGRLLTKNSFQVTGASSVTDVIVKQRIESLIAANFCSQTVTVQAQVYNNSGGSITPTLTVKHAGSQDVWTSPTTDVSAVSLQACANGAWTQVAYTFSANASSYNGLEISLDFGNNFGSSGKSIQITECDIRVAPGAAAGATTSNPPPPELRPIHTELEFCRRYFETSYDLGTAPGTGSGTYNGMVNTGAGYSTGESVATGGSIPFEVSKRADPTMNYWDGSGNSGMSSRYYGGAWHNDVDTITAVTAGQTGAILTSNAGAGGAGASIFLHFQASAEL